MKKTAIILAAAIMLTLTASCGRSRGEDVLKRLEDGKEVTVGVAVETLTNSFVYHMIDELKTGLESKGIAVEYRTSEGDDAIMSSQIEEFIEKEVDAIVCAPPRAEGVKAALLAAQDAGIPVIMMGCKPDYSDELSGGVYVNWEELGYEIGKMASAWVDIRYPDAGGGQIRAANIISSSQESMILQNQGLLRAVSEDERIVIVYTQQESGTAEGGQAAAQAALEYDPAIKIFFCYQDGPALGVSAYVTELEPEEEPESGIETEELDIADYACFTGGIQQGSLTALSKSAQGGSILRGVVEYGTHSTRGNLSASQGLIDTVYAVLTGSAEGSTWVEDDRWARTSFGYEYLFDNPKNDFRAR